MLQRRTVVVAFRLFVFAGVMFSATAGDWPTFRADASRSGYTPEVLSTNLNLTWTYQSVHPPMPAWPTRNRLRYDTVYQPVISGGALFFGSSADGKVYALDAVTGRLKWEFFTDGPVRFAPAAWKDRVFAVSDDGHLYCLSAKDGRLLWKRHGGSRPDMILGNDRMISRWPARGGPVVADNIVYFAAGIWPSEGIFICALNPLNGKVLWCNNSSGSLEMDQPHPTARSKSGVAAQGYLAIDGDRLVVPTGRAVPAFFDRSDGKFLYCWLQPNVHVGGCDVMTFDRWFFNGGAVFTLIDETMIGKMGTVAALHPDYLLVSGKTPSLNVIDRKALVVEKQITGPKGQKKTGKGLAAPLWTIKLPEEVMLKQVRLKGSETPGYKTMGSTAWYDLSIEGQPAALITAGDYVIVGGRDRVLMFDLRSRNQVWSADVEGEAGGLAMADGRLFVSTDKGMIYCFCGTVTGKPATIKAAIETEPEDPLYQAAADEIIRRTGIKEGYCVDFGCGDGRLALALARRTSLQIYGVEQDATKVEAARRMLDRAGFYGKRVMIHQTNLAKVPYPNSFADLIVSQQSVEKGTKDFINNDVRRMQRPYGGVVCVGRSGAMELYTRGPVEGAGNWTHQHTDSANTLCSEDLVIRAPVSMLWFRDTDFVLPLRHGRGPAPLVDSGRMFIGGLHGMRAMNIYNGRTLWEYPLENLLLSYHSEHSIGAAWTDGHYCLGGNRLYVNTGDRCVCLDVESGKKIRELNPPAYPNGKPGTWGYIAYEGGLLFGTLAETNYLVRCWSPLWNTGGQFIQSVMFFAMDPDTGKIKWTYKPERSIRNNAIAISKGRVYLIDRDIARVDDIQYPVQDLQAEAKRLAKANDTHEDDEIRALAPQPPNGRLLALAASTGQVLWKTDENVFGSQLAVSEKYGLLLMCYQPVHQASLAVERGDRMAVFKTVDGSRVWDVSANYEARPILNDRTIYAEPGAWDLLTGQKTPFMLKRSYGCGIPAGSRNLLVFRSGTLGYVDLTKGDQVENYGGIRPGCWVNVIPAGGLLVMADAASWCTCSYLNQATIALEPASASLLPPIL
ncbi:MAG: PQQ-binding-like beta-propeller repeat protein [Kiritimatiellae bacterium]|nr:PQQ-binding-like beta-propeller repeat protein [Kiritimatiellia bacterium]